MSRSAAPWPAGAPCWVDCQVDDPARAAAFYAGLLGWGFGEHDAATDGYLTASLDGAKAAGIGPKASGAGMPSVWHTYFAVDDVDAAAASVAATGGTVLMMPFNVGTSGRMAMAADPRGATFGLWRGTGLPGADVTHRCGAYGWSELRTPDTGRAARFYEWLFGWAFADGDARVIVLGSAVESYFSAGADLKAFQGMKSAGFPGTLPNPYRERSTVNLHYQLSTYLGTGAPRGLDH